MQRTAFASPLMLDGRHCTHNSGAFLAVKTRTQLSLFVAPPHAEPLNALRRVLDPLQAALIPAHVTLCREDELAGISRAELRLRLGSSGVRAIGLSFGPPQSFHGHGVLLPAVGDQSGFEGLRRIALGQELVRSYAPHITLAHPRNPKDSGNTDANIRLAPAGLHVTFAEAVVIEQIDGGEWQVLERFCFPNGQSSTV